MNLQTQKIMALLMVPGIGQQLAKRYLFSDDLETILLEKYHLNQTMWQLYLERAEWEWKTAQELDIKVISYLDRDFPRRLSKLTKFPAILYAKGNLKLLQSEKNVAVIGTREPMAETEIIGKQFCEWLVNNDYVIVSGLAKGCDTIAHQAAIDHNGATIAILAHGLDQKIYPQENTQLAQSILDSHGLLLSPYALGTQVRPYYLASRDEWESGLADKVLVLETHPKNGTNNTIRYALNQSRPVRAVRGDFLNIDYVQSLEQLEKFVSE